MNNFSAPAKVNLHLKVTRTREDGYHELDTSFAFVDVGDQLTITPANSLSVTCSDTRLNGENNLVYKILHALRKQQNISSGLSVHIDKQLPEQSGLGGGSSDAATALMIANKMWNLNISTEELIKFSAGFGADIPCFLFGRASMAKGIGELLTPYPAPLPESHLLLAYPTIGLSTAEVFRHYDQQKNQQNNPQRQASRLTRYDGADTIRANSEMAVGDNDLEAAACSLSSRMNAMLTEMRKVSKTAWMSGSGSTCAALFSSREEAKESANMLKNRALANWTHVGKLLDEHPLQILG